MAHLFIIPADLAARLHLPQAPRILDMRDDEDAAADPRRIPGARALQIAELDARDPSSDLTVCTCQKGGKLSQLGAAILRARGAAAVCLAGGHLGWLAENLPLASAAPLPDRWVLPLDPGWAELSALWVLRRLLDRDVPVMPVERDWLDPAAEAWSAARLPASAREMARRADLEHPLLACLDGGPERLLAGRLARVSSPDAALDLVDDWIAAMEAAA